MKIKIVFAKRGDKVTLLTASPLYKGEEDIMIHIKKLGRNEHSYEKNKLGEVGR